jgi:hypothetical protein
MKEIINWKGEVSPLGLSVADTWASTVTATDEDLRPRQGAI